MRLLSISTDRHICQPESLPARRQIAYGEHFDHTDIVVLALATHGCAPRVLSDRVHVKATNSHTKFLYWWDVLQLTRSISRPDIMIVQDPFEVGFLGMLLAGWWKAPLYVQVHTDLFSDGYWNHSLANKIRVLISYFTLHRAARIRVVASRIKKDIEARGFEAPVTVLPIFVETKKKEKKRRERSGTLQLLWVGRLESEKNPTLALDVLSELSDRGTSATLTLVGKGSLQKTLMQESQKRGMGDSVTFVGETDDVQSYYLEHDVLLVTSEYEGYGLVIVEALATGLPVISTDVGVARESGARIASAHAVDFVRIIDELVNTEGYQAQLKNYPYVNEEEYVRAYVDDINKSL